MLTQNKMLQTSVSLVVDDDCDSSELDEESTEHASISHALNELNSEPAHPSTAGTDNPKRWQQLPVTISSIATSAESISYWRGLVEDDFVPVTAAARPTAAAIRATPATSTAAATTLAAFTTAAAVTTAAATTSAPTAAAATFAATAAASTSTAVAATATAAAPTATAVTTAKAAAALSAALRATVASKAAYTSTATTRKDRRPKIGKRRRKQPAIREPLAALEKEQKLYELRDRQRQEYVADKSYRRPYAQAKKEQGSSDESDVVSVRRGNSTVARKSADLKNILKNAGGLSLSEILQQKNLSLDDLLKGKQTALLALQTTAATAPQQKPQSSIRTPTHQRRKSTPQPATSTTAIPSQESSEEFATIKQTKQPKHKLKLPALQRLKLFGSSSRATANSGEVSTMGKRKNATAAATRASSTTTTTTSTTTKRVPIYRKRQQLLQRSTLKPLGLLKSTAIATTATISTMSTTAAETKSTSTVSTSLVPAISSRESSDEFKEAQNDEENEADLLTSTTTNKPTTTTIEVAGTATVTTTSTNSLASSSVISKIQTRYDKNPKTNIIELDEQPRKATDSADAAVTYAADDDLEDFFEESTTKGFSNSSSSPAYSSVIDRVTPRLDRQSARPTNDYDNLSYVDPVDDRTDLLELIEDRRSGNRLFKVLEQRNMTLEELIEHRKRGSSQLHLAMVVQNRSRFFPDKKVILRDNMDIVTAFENFPHFNLMNLKSVKPDEIKTDSQGSSYFTSIIDIEPTDEIYKDENKEAGSGSSSSSGNLKGPTYAQPQRSEKSLGVFPPWKTFALASLAHPAHAVVNQQQQFFLPQPKLLLDNTSDDSNNLQELPAESETLLNEDNHVANPVDTVEAIENEVARAHDLLDLELSGHGFKRSPAAVAASMTKHQHNNNNSIYGNMPAGIRSAIVASAAIVLTSLATFMVIFVVCRWKQHKQRKTNYMKTYNAMKSKLPMIATTPTSRQSSLHSHHIELDSSLVQSSTHQHSHAHQQQKQAGTSLFRSSSNHSLSCGGAVGGIGISTSTLLSAGRPGGLGTGSTTSLALSMTSTHNVSSTKLNTMDPNSPEVQEYLYDALRKSF